MAVCRDSTGNAGTSASLQGFRTIGSTVNAYLGFLFYFFLSIDLLRGVGKKWGPVKENQAAARAWPFLSWSQFMVFTGSLCKMLACSEVKLKDLLRNLNKFTVFLEVHRAVSS